MLYGERIKHITSKDEVGEILNAIAAFTGYDYDFIEARYNDGIEDGLKVEDALEEVRDISLERDW